MIRILRDLLYSRRCLSRSLTAFLIPALIIFSPGRAYATDCTAVKTTNAPYQMDIERDGPNTYSVQIYRGANLTRRQLSIVNNKIYIAAFQANFQLENSGLHGETIRTVYSIPTDKYIWAQDTRVVHVTSLTDGKPASGPGFDATYTMLPDEVVVVGNCSFLTRRYTVRQVSPSITVMSEVWFSPELNTILRMTSATSIASTGKTTRATLEAKAIATEFAAFR